MTRGAEAAGVLAASELIEALDQTILLLDENLAVTEPVSAAMRRLLRRDIVRGMPLTGALSGIIGAASLESAVQLARAALSAEAGARDRAAMRDVPGISLPGSGGAAPPRFDLEFHLLQSTAGLRRVLVFIADVSEQRQAAQQLEQLRNANDLAVSVLRAESQSLGLFLDTASASMSLVNSLLRMPARSEAAFRAKLERIHCEMQALAEDARELQLRAIGDRARGFADALAQLRQRSGLNGDDLLPLAPRLDELFGQIEAVAALNAERGSCATPNHRMAGSAPDQPGAPGAGDADDRIRRLADRIAAEHQREVSLLVLGLADVPPAYRNSVDNILAHLVRNAIEHGIEPPVARAQAGKPPAGTLIVEFSASGARGYELMVQDDGAGFDVERIGRIAVERGLLTPEAVASTDPRKLVGLIFRPGFSTAAAQDSSEITGAAVAGAGTSGAGRGLGMEFLRELVTRLEGNITVSTKRGRYTRFRVSLPLPRARPAGKASPSAAPAAAATAPAQDPARVA